jgi:hypothetical protein
MGTFHSDKGELHGITIVVDMKGPQVWVGRCDEADDERVILLDADVHEEARGGHSKEDYIKRAAKVGIWKKHDRVEIPRSEVASIRRLGEI